MPPRTNSKAQAGRDRKAEQKSQKQAAEERQRDQQEAVEWQKGSDLRGAGRKEAAAAKADEAARKRREKEELLAAEEAIATSTSSTTTTAKIKTTRSGKKNKKKQDDLSLLADALVQTAEKKTRAKRELEKKKQQQLQQQEEEARRRVEEQEKSMDPLLLNTQGMLGVHAAGRHVNKALEDQGASGIDAALESMTVGGSGGGDVTKSAKALFKEFEERMLPVIKEESPGLRLSQYKEKIWQLWKKSPENPANQQQV